MSSGTSAHDKDVTAVGAHKRTEDVGTKFGSIFVKKGESQGCLQGCLGGGEGRGGDRPEHRRLGREHEHQAEECDRAEEALKDALKVMVPGCTKYGHLVDSVVMGTRDPRVNEESH